MKTWILRLIYSLLFLCVSMYLGTGWSLLLFSFPVAAKLTVANYYLQIVPQVALATAFFTPMTKVMITANLVMIVAEWRSRLRWLPIIVFAAIVAATIVEVKLIMPLSAMLSNRISDQEELNQVMARWMYLNEWRIALWTTQWFGMMAYFLAAWFPNGRPRETNPFFTV